MLQVHASRIITIDNASEKFIRDIYGWTVISLSYANHVRNDIPEKWVTFIHAYSIRHQASATMTRPTQFLNHVQGQGMLSKLIQQNPSVQDCRGSAQNCP